MEETWKNYATTSQNMVVIEEQADLGMYVIPMETPNGTVEIIQANNASVTSGTPSNNTPVVATTTFMDKQSEDGSVLRTAHIVAHNDNGITVNVQTN